MAETGVLDRLTDTEADRAAITAQVRASGTSFFWAMRFLPRVKREAIFAVYAFCRAVDDVADGDLPPDGKRAELEAWRNEIDQLFEGRPSRVVTRALASPVTAFGLEKSAFLAIIDGMEMDAQGPIRAPSIDELNLYCDRVAGAVGLLCVRIFGLKGEAGGDLAVALGRALQLTNILRDLAEDAAIGRLYLPRELLESEGISTRNPQAVLAHPGLPAVARALAERARQCYARAQAIMAAADPETVRPARIMMEVYRPMLERLARDDFATVAAARSEGKLARIWGKARKFAVALRYALV